MRGQTNKPVRQKRLQRILRKGMTQAEQHIWRHLRKRQINGFKFRRQHPYGDYILDFVCLEAKLVVEIDGGQHVEAAVKDQGRDDTLNQAGFRVLRFWNHEVLGKVDAVMEVIHQALQPHPHPNLPPEGEGVPERR